MEYDFSREKLKAFCEALELENIDALMDCGVDTFRDLGKTIAAKTKALKVIQQTELEFYVNNRYKLPITSTISGGCHISYAPSEDFD